MIVATKKFIAIMFFINEESNQAYFFSKKWKITSHAPFEILKDYIN